MNGKERDPMTTWRRILELSCRATFTLALVLLAGVMVYPVLGARPAEAPTAEEAQKNLDDWAYDQELEEVGTE